MHPGEAVVVGNTSISMSKLDDMSATLCKVAAAQAAQQGQQVAAGDARRAAAATLIQNTVAKKLADELNISVPPSSYTPTDQEMQNAYKAFGKSDPEALRTLIETSKQTQVLIERIGAAKLGVDPKSADSQKVQSAGTEALKKAISDADISIDPRLGLTSKVVKTETGSGSLSVGVSDLSSADVSNLGGSQRCS